LTYFQRVSGGYLLALICLMVLSGVVTYVVCQYQNQTLRLRNQFLEQRYVEQMKQDVDAGQSMRQPVVHQQEMEKIFESRDGNLLTKVYVSPDDYGLDVETIDLDTHQVIGRHSENSYFPLLKSVEGMVTSNVRSVYLKTEGIKQYAVIDTFIGNIESADSIREVYVAVFDTETEKIVIKSFLIEPVSVKSMAMMRVYGSEKILDYFPQSQKLLIESHFFDNCGGDGSFRLLSANGLQDVQDYGAGCVLQARYLGYIEDRLYFGEIDLTKADVQNWEDAKITAVYSLNPLTKERKNLQVDLANYVFDTTWKDATDRISATELVFFDKTTEEGYALDVETLGLRNLGKLFDE
jgi:hypothetical protein